MSNFGTQNQTIVRVRLATSAALAANTYSDQSALIPSSTLGAKLLANAVGALSIDGVAVATDDEVLIKDEATQKNNGIYRVRNPGSATAKYLLTRSRDAQASEQFIGSAVLVGSEGTANPNQTFVFSGSAAPVVGTDAITYANVAALAATAGALSADPQFFAPTTGQTVTVAASGQNIAVFINPAGTISAATLTFPTGTFKGQRCSVNTTQIITTLTVTATNTDTKGLAQPTAATATSTWEWVWDSVSGKWNRTR